MNKAHNRVQCDADKQAAITELAAVFRTAATECPAAAKAGKEALPRLVTAAMRGGSQSAVICAWLASLYNGGDALRVRLDDVRLLDWSLKKDLLAVVLGLGNDGFADTEIREEFRRQSGEAGVDELHWYTTGAAHREALGRLVEFATQNAQSSTGKAIREALSSICGRDGAKADLSRLNYQDDQHTRDFILVLDGLFGRAQGLLSIEDVSEACSRGRLF